MTDLINLSDLNVPASGLTLDYLFFNNRWAVIARAINSLNTQQQAFSATTDTLVAIGLQRINTVLGPLLTELQAAASNGFLVALAEGQSITLNVDVDIQFEITSPGLSVFTPTPWLLAMDENDSDNWGILSLTSYNPSNGILATHCVYASKAEASTKWSISCSSAVFPAMLGILADARQSALAASASEDQVAGIVTEIQSLQTAIEAGPVASVAGKTGVVTLNESDIANLSSDLAAKASTVYVDSNIAGKQPLNAQLTSLAALTLSAGKLLGSTGPGAFTLITLNSFGQTLLAETSAAGTRTDLGLGDAATHPASDFATPASVTSAIASATINSNQIAAVFDDQVGITYTMQTADYGKTVTFTNSGAITVTLPNSLAKGWNVLCYQGGAGQVTFTAGSGATLRNRQNKTKTAGQYAMVSLEVVSNSSGTSAVYVLSGDCV
jgi:hypothetical protein